MRSLASYAAKFNIDTRQSVVFSNLEQQLFIGKFLTHSEQR